MKKLTLIFIIILCIAFLSGCIGNDDKENNGSSTPEDGDTRLKETVLVNGTYNPSILYEEMYLNGQWNDITSIAYTKNGKYLTGAFIPYMLGALSWIKTNTSKNSTIFCWWDYGHMVEGLAERNAIATFASSHLEDTIVYYSYFSDEKKNADIEKKGGWNPKEKLEDIAKVFTCDNLSSYEIKGILEKYNVSYILTRRYDTEIAIIYFKWFDKNTSEYVVDNKLTDRAKQTLIFQLWMEKTIPYGLQLIGEFRSEDVYFFNYVRLFKVIL